MLAVVVDDHDMGVTHVIRGDDHLNNAFRQLAIIRAMGWPEPVYAHVPLIHGPDGAKLSKRHGALGVEAYRDELGILPEALSNYLLRLGWGHGDDEIIRREDAVRWFDLDHVGRSPSRFDIKKLENLNGHYIREADDGRLAGLVAPRVAPLIGRDLGDRRDRACSSGRCRSSSRARRTSTSWLRTRPSCSDRGRSTWTRRRPQLLAGDAPRPARPRPWRRSHALDEWTAEATEQAVRRR